MLGFAVFEDRQATDCVCEIERGRSWVGAIDFQRFVLAGLSQVQLALILEDVGKVPDRVCQFERIALRGIDRDCLFVVLSGCIKIAGIAFNLAESGRDRRLGRNRVSHRRADPLAELGVLASRVAQRRLTSTVVYKKTPTTRLTRGNRCDKTWAGRLEIQANLTMHEGGVHAMKIRFAMLFSVLLLPSLFGQTSSTEVLGTITDSSGLVISGAEVILTRESTGVSRKTESNREGIYRFPLVDPADYRIEVRMAGFKSAKISNIDVLFHQRARVDVTLEVGQLTQTVEVQAEARLLNTEDAAVGPR